MATVRRPNSLAARRMRMAISLRFSARSFFMDGVRGKQCTFLRITGGARVAYVWAGGSPGVARGDGQGVAPRKGRVNWCVGLVVVRGVDIGEAGVSLGEFFQHEDRIGGANRNAGPAIDAIVRF